ncbi:MAG TPA: endonuclease III [Pseudobdellovibrionaceae bacterium]|nr:endonuclease III [Pseudobdellovibrionaceae bacterium]
MPESPYPIASMFRRIRRAVAIYPKATLFDLKDRGHATLFEQLVACILSIRTYDEVSLVASLALFRKARDASALSKLSVEEIDELIRPVTFHGQKARTLLSIAEEVQKRFQGNLPPDDEVLQSLKGVGPKCAHLALGIAAGLPFIGVDIHVHRVTNRWGYVQTASPEKTMRQLEGRLPKSRWIEINELLVPFGKHICVGQRPFCSRCPVLEECRRVGVRHPR